MTVIGSVVMGDNAFGTLGSGLATGDTALAFTSGHGARFPAVTGTQVMYCCILNSANIIEEVKITAHAAGSDSATMVRGVGGTTAKAWNSGDRIEARFSSSTLSDVITTMLTEAIVIACSDETTALTAGTSKATFIIPFSGGFTATGVIASLTTPQSTGNIFTVDIKLAGSSILSTKITIDNTETDSTTAVTPPVISTSALTGYGKITVDISQIGDGTAKGLKVYIIGNKT